MNDTRRNSAEEASLETGADWSDPTSTLDTLRAAQLSHLLVIAASHLDMGELLSDGPVGYADICQRLGLRPRAANVYLTALRSLGLIEVAVNEGSPPQSLGLTSVGRNHLAPDSPNNLRGYLALGAASADVQHMLECLRNDAPAGDVSFVYHEGKTSALDEPTISDGLTRAMAARARNIAPAVAAAVDASQATTLIDVGGGHAIYSIELLKRFPQLRAVIVDRAPPLRVAEEYAQEAGLSERVDLQMADIHRFECDVAPSIVLMANILHDYDADAATALVARYAKQLGAGGRLVILDSFLNPIEEGAPPVSDGPREVAAYSAMLFSICEGRCYRLDEYQAMMRIAGLSVDPRVVEVPARGSLLTGYAG